MDDLLLHFSPFPLLLHGKRPWREIAAEMDPNLMLHGLGAEDFELSKYSDEKAVQEATLFHEFIIL